MLHGGRRISSVPEFLQPKEPSTVTTTKSPSSEHTYKPYEVSKSVVNPLTTPPPPYQTKPRRASPLSDARNDYEDGSKDDSHLLRPIGKVGFLEDYRTVMVQRAVFQVLASMALPAFTIHSVCSFSLQLGIYMNVVTDNFLGCPLLWSCPKESQKPDDQDLGTCRSRIGGGTSVTIYFRSSS